MRVGSGMSMPGSTAPGTTVTAGPAGPTGCGGGISAAPRRGSSTGTGMADWPAGSGSGSISGTGSASRPKPGFPA